MAAVPVYRWWLAPDGLATAVSCPPAGFGPAGRTWPRRSSSRGPLVASLYSIEQAKPVRPMTPAKWAALAKANAARRMCRECRRDAGYVIPASLGACVSCAYPDQQAAA